MGLHPCGPGTEGIAALSVPPKLYASAEGESNRHSAAWCHPAYRRAWHRQDVAKTAGLLKSKKLAYLEIEPHSLQSSALGKSQKAVTELFGGTIAEHAQNGPTFVLLDEVETLIADRSKLSLEANPVDVHRATDAALVQLGPCTCWTDRPTRFV